MSQYHQPFLSVVTVCYNSGKTIERTLKSVVDQTFTDYEYIIIDGCSTDDTLSIIDGYREKFKHLEIVSEPDNGIYEAMNKGIVRAKGTIIALLNSDDWLENNALEKVYAAYNGEEEIITGSLNFWYDESRYLVYETSLDRFERMKKKHLSPIRHPATFVPLSVYHKVGLFNVGYKIIGDTDFIYRCIDCNVKFKFVHDVLTNMSDGGASTSLRHLLKRGRERLRFLRSRNVKKIPILLDLFRYLLFSAIRKIAPSFILKLHNRA